MNILFVSHAASRGGAAGVLLQLLRHIKEETPHRATILSVRTGPLADEFARFATPFPHPMPFYIATQWEGAIRRAGEIKSSPPALIKWMMSRGIRVNDRQTRAVARGLPRFDVVYANSAASGAAVRGLEPVLRRGAKLVVHVHELAYALSRNQPGWDFLRARGDFFIAASDAVRRELVGQGIAPERVEVVYEWLDFAALATDKEKARRSLRAQIGAPDEAVLVGGCGTIEHRKGADWWVQSAFHAIGVEPNARKSPAPLHFVWLGGGDSPWAREVKRDVAGYGLNARVHFLPPSDQPNQFFAGLDAFCLNSREDPFPLVAVEAGAQGVPVACFKGAGGAEELVGQTGGAVVAWGDTGAMGRTLASWGRDADFRAQLGRGLHSRAVELCDARHNCARVVALLESGLV